MCKELQKFAAPVNRQLRHPEIQTVCVVAEVHARGSVQHVPRSLPAHCVSILYLLRKSPGESDARNSIDIPIGENENHMISYSTNIHPIPTRDCREAVCVRDLHW